MSSKLIVAVTALAVVAGCQTLTSDGGSVADGVMRVTHGTSFSHAGLLYEVGREHFAAGRHTLATESFEKALAADQKFLEARNALGIAWATRGNYEEAIVHLERAVKEAPDRADFHNNLGYALHLQGRLQDALPRFRQAASLEPDNPRFQGNLQTALTQLGGATRVASNEQKVPVRVNNERGRNQTTLRWSPEGEKAAIAAEATNRRAVATAQDAASFPSPGPQTAAVQVAAVEKPVARVEPARDPKVSEPIRDITAQAAVPALVTGFEVTNGNGVVGMARRVAALLRAHGITVAKISNLPRFTQAKTEVQFRPGHEEDALRMQGALSTPAKIVENPNLRDDVNVRLVIGRDSGRDNAAAARLVARPARPTQAASAGALVDETEVR